MLRKIVVGCLATGMIGTSIASVQPWYLSADAGIFQGLYQVKYNDLTDLIPQNINQSIQQLGYTAGLGVGYQKQLCENYLIGLEFSAHYDSNSAYFGVGGASTGFSEKLYIQNNEDLSLIPGLLLNNDLLVYGRVGLSYANVRSELTSPSGFNAQLTNWNQHQNVWGGVLGLGLRKFFNPHFSIYSEFNYHDYGTVSFSNFQNFTATYNHNAHLHSQTLNLGISYAL